MTSISPAEMYECWGCQVAYHQRCIAVIRLCGTPRCPAAVPAERKAMVLPGRARKGLALFLAAAVCLAGVAVLGFAFVQLRSRPTQAVPRETGGTTSVATPNSGQPVAPAPSGTQSTATVPPVRGSQDDLIAVATEIVRRNGDVYAQALRSCDPTALATVFTGDALAFYRVRVAQDCGGTTATLLALVLTSATFRGDSSGIIIMTHERWRFSRGATCTEFEYDEQYVLVPQASSWRITSNPFTETARAACH